jgi:uncharacterized protein DUF3105
MRRRARRLVSAAAGAVAFAAFSSACGTHHESAQGVADDAAVDHIAAKPDAGALAPPSPPVFDAAFFDASDADASACNVQLQTPPLMASPHVPEGTVVAYGSNPPSSGPHYPIWADFREYATPVDDEYLVHSMEHGAVLLLYRCAAPCDDLVASLRALRDAVPTDPLCDASMGERVRVILAPRAANDVAVAAAAWGNTYRADCFDGPSLAKFVADHYAHGPESSCSPGKPSF